MVEAVINLLRLVCALSRVCSFACKSGVCVSSRLGAWCDLLSADDGPGSKHTDCLEGTRKSAQTL